MDQDEFNHTLSEIAEKLDHLSRESMYVKDDIFAAGNRAEELEASIDEVKTMIDNFIDDLEAQEDDEPSIEELRARFEKLTT